MKAWITTSTKKAAKVAGGTTAFGAVLWATVTYFPLRSEVEANYRVHETGLKHVNSRITEIKEDETRKDNKLFLELQAIKREQGEGFRALNQRIDRLMEGQR